MFFHKVYVSTVFPTLTFKYSFFLAYLVWTHLHGCHGPAHKTVPRPLYLVVRKEQSKVWLKSVPHRQGFCLSLRHPPSVWCETQWVFWVRRAVRDVLRNPNVHSHCAPGRCRWTPFLELTRLLLFLSPEVWSHKGGKKLSKDYRDPLLRQWGLVS